MEEIEKELEKVKKQINDSYSRLRNAIEKMERTSDYTYEYMSEMYDIKQDLIQVQYKINKHI